MPTTNAPCSAGIPSCPRAAGSQNTPAGCSRNSPHCSRIPTTRARSTATRDARPTGPRCRHRAPSPGRGSRSHAGTTRLRRSPSRRPTTRARARSAASLVSGAVQVTAGRAQIGAPARRRRIHRLPARGRGCRRCRGEHRRGARPPTTAARIGYTYPNAHRATAALHHHRRDHRLGAAQGEQPRGADYGGGADRVDPRLPTKPAPRWCTCTCATTTQSTTSNPDKFADFHERHPQGLSST